MVRSLNSGVSALQQFQQRMDVIGNNIANVNTTGFKSARVDFADAFSQTYRGSSAGNGTTSNTDPIQIGTGVQTQSIKNSFIQGSLGATGPQTDLAIVGEGFFVVKEPVSAFQYATRAGDFRIDDQFRLVTNDGMRVQGYTDSTLTTIGDILIDNGSAPATAAPGATLASYGIALDGTISVTLTDGTQYTRGQILMQRFTDPNALVKEGNNLYSGMAAAGPLAALSPSPTNGLGKMKSGYLELSNVDLASEFAGMITTQRAFQASARIITTSDEMLQELVNLKR